MVLPTWNSAKFVSKILRLLALQRATMSFTFVYRTADKRSLRYLSSERTQRHQLFGTQIWVATKTMAQKESSTMKVGGSFLWGPRKNGFPFKKLQTNIALKMMQIYIVSFSMMFLNFSITIKISASFLAISIKSNNYISILWKPR